MLKKILLLITFLSTLSLWAQQTQTKWNVFNESNFSIQYPADWALDQSGQMGITFSIHSTLTSEQDLYRENVNLIIHDLRGSTIYLNKFVTMTESKLPTILTNFSLIESKRVNNTGEFHKIIFTGDQGNNKLKFEQYLWVKGIRAYVLTFTAEQTQFDNYQQMGEKILNSFKIK